MRIAFEKISDDRHALEIARDDGTRERVECETRSYLMHDLLHYAVESEASLDVGFWGNLAKGKTLADMNDRTGRAMEAENPAMAPIEGIVGAMSSAVKGRTAREMIAGFERYASALDSTLPAWLTEDFVARVQERMRRLTGQWSSVRYGGKMELGWP